MIIVMMKVPASSLLALSVRIQPPMAASHIMLLVLFRNMRKDNMHKLYGTSKFK